MKRRLFNIASALSLLLCLAMPVLWVRSSWVADDVAWTQPVHGNPHYTAWIAGVGTNQHGLDFHFQKRNRPNPAFNLSMARHADPDDLARPTWSWLGFQGLAWNPPPMANTDLVSLYVLEVPYWFFFALGCVLPLLWTWRFWVHIGQKQRRDAGLCLACGYDLRASKDRCPECGTPIPVNPSAI